MPELTTLDSNYSDAGYWQQDHLEDDLDVLLSEYE